MTRKLDYFLTLASPWTYLGHAMLRDIAARHDLAVTLHPLPFAQLFPETGGAVLPKRHPVRQRYRTVELQRWRDRRDLPLTVHPRHFPANVTLADGVVLASLAAGLDPDRFVRACLRALWAEERDIADPATLRALLADAGLPDLLEAAASPATASAYLANRDLALAAGVFGAPSYVLEGEVFWGQDRLELLEATLASGRQAFAPV